MRKLNQRKVRWIIKEVNNPERSIYRIAKTQDVTPQWTRELYQRYRESSPYPYPKKPGIKPSSISLEEKRIVLFEDDTSRFITGFGVFYNATSANAISVFKRAIQTYGMQRKNR